MLRLGSQSRIIALTAEPTSTRHIYGLECRDQISKLTIERDYDMMQPRIEVRLCNQKVSS